MRKAHAEICFISLSVRRVTQKFTQIAIGRVWAGAKYEGETRVWATDSHP